MNSTIHFTKRLTAIALCLFLALSLISLPEKAMAASEGVTNAKVILRKEANKESKALQSLPKGEEVDILKTSGDWYKVRYGKYTGYLMKKYVSTSSAPASSSSSSSSSTSSSRIEALGSAPGIMRPGDSNTDVEKLQKALKILGYYTGSIDGKYGNGTTKAVKAYQKDEGLTADGYAGERTIKSLFGSCSSKSLSTQSAPGSSSASSSPSSSKPSSKYSTVSSIAEIGSAPGKCQQGDSGANVVKVQQALEFLGYYNGAIDGDFGKGTVSAVKAFQKRRGMKADGIVGPATIRVLFGKEAAESSSSSSKTKTETLDWFADKVTSKIPKNARFTIKDVATGKTFEAVRWSGSNHIDAEPRTAKDTATMKSIFGGSWSWNRRAILIQYNGHVYAASMNGMPHGTTTISGNNFDGHFCIHFKNSKTHETARVDEDHQNAVNRASRASW